MNQLKLGREKLPWSQEVWDRIDQAVHEECKRTKVACKFIPMYGPVSSGQLTIPSDTTLVDEERRLAVDETAVEPLCELLVEFILTPQQVEREEELMTAVTLATRAANLISQAEDVIIFQGQSAVNPGPNQHPLFSDRKVRVRSGPLSLGLLEAPPEIEVKEEVKEEKKEHPQIVYVPPLESPGPQQRWGENTFGAVAEAYSNLQGGDGLAQAHYGPYALVLHFVPYADTFAPLPTTLIMPADRISRLVTCGICVNSMYSYGYGRGMHGMKDSMNESMNENMNMMNNMNSYEQHTHFYGTGTLPEYRGFLMSLGGNTVDLVVGMDTKTAFLQEDTDGRYRFRVYERFALRLKDRSSVIVLKFQESASTNTGAY